MSLGGNKKKECTSVDDGVDCFCGCLFFCLFLVDSITGDWEMMFCSLFQCFSVSFFFLCLSVSRSVSRSVSLSVSFSLICFEMGKMSDGFDCVGG